ncbi:MAG: TlpA family protein disulfide reductase [Planctomycetes bacterium]|nr:TlpA family protein disulfide reductase [Planctomycetota bacterium]
MPLALSWLLSLGAFVGIAHAQDSADASLRAAYDAWQVEQTHFSDAALAARRAGLVAKGAELPMDVQALQRVADAARDTLLAEYGERDDLSAESDLLIARLHESRRVYLDAAKCYERSLSKGPPERPELDTLGALCLAAMNGKDDVLAARWMQALIAEEDQRGGATQRNLSVRTSWYPRTLIALGRWDELGRLIETLESDETATCRAAAASFGVVHAIHVEDLDRVRARLSTIERDAARFPDLQSWAAIARLALDVHDGRFEEGATAVRAFLARAADESREPSAVERNQRRYLVAIEPFLGKPAPELLADHVVGGELARDGGILAGLRGKVVVLDFWQPWCEPCRKAMPELVALQSEHRDALQVLGLCKVENYGYDVSERKAVRPIAPSDYVAHVADFREDMGLAHPLLVASTAANSEAYHVTGIPTLVVIDRRGVVRYMSCGAGEPGLFRLAVSGVLFRDLSR